MSTRSIDEQRRVYDVAVVGAGPAGATAAIVLARAGKRVALIEKEALPRYKTCGGGVVGRAFGMLPPDVRIPIEHPCPSAEANFLESELSFRVERERPIVSMTMRADLDRTLAEAAVASGADLLASCELRNLAQDVAGVALETSRGTVRASWVVGADGSLSTVARKAGWKHPLRTIPALEAELRVTPDVHARFAGVARFDFEAMRAGYGWVFPKRAHLSCGILTTERGIGGLREALGGYLSRIGLPAPQPDELHGYVIPVRPRRGGFVRGRVLLAGDAAGLADPLTCEGISIGIWSGMLAANCLARERPDPSAYVRSLRREILPELRVARALAWITYRQPKLARSLLRRRGRAFTERLTDVFLGERTYTSLLRRPSSYLSLIRAR